jgi:hypothetical protein
MADWFEHGDDISVSIKAGNFLIGIMVEALCYKQEGRGLYSR